MKAKQHLFFVTIATLLCGILLLFSCTKDDDPGTVDKKQLVLSVSSTQIEKGSEVTFSATIEGQPVEAKIFLEGNEIAGNTYSFQEVGSYSAVAKNALYLDSKPLVITVIEAGDEGDVDIYIAGMEKNTTGNRIPKYWKNGVEQVLELGQYGGFITTSIFVDGLNNDVYVGGHCYAPGTDIFVATIWKNGEQLLWGDGIVGTTISSITVVDGDVYAIGSQKNVGIGTLSYTTAYWKNGVRLLEDVLTGQGRAIGVDFDGGVHLVTYRQSNAYVWPDGVETPLEDSENAMGLFLDNNTQYIVGKSSADTGNKAAYWKNGIINYISPMYDNLIADKIFVSNGDIYISGWSNESTNRQALYWKNNSRTNLTSPEQIGLATGIFVIDDDVYVVGDVENPGVFQSQVTLWKNGEPTYITDGTRMATGLSIFVVKK